jgi:uncharacterized protein YbjQ (UPF0145 family)
MDALVACPCQSCNEPIEFDSSLFQSGTTITCPHCGAETTLVHKTGMAVPLSQWGNGSLIVTTGNEVSGHAISDYLGIARGIVVRSPDMLQGSLGQLKEMIGGNIESYIQVCEETRREAFNRMVQQAHMMRADALIAVRYDATEFAPGVTEVLAYGTAVKLSKVGVTP